MYFLFNQEKKKQGVNLQLIKLDTTNIQSIILNTKIDNYQDVRLQRVQKKWLISKDNFTTQAFAQQVDSLLALFTDIEAHHVRTPSKNKSSNYGFGHSSNTRVRILGDLIHEDFYISDLTTTQKAYMRLANEKEVFEVSGIFHQLNNQSFNKFRDQRVHGLDIENIRTLQFSEMKDSIQLLFHKSGDDWQNNDLNLEADSLMDNYLKQIESLKSNHFIYDFDPLTHQDFLDLQLILESEYKSCEIKCYRDSLRTPEFIITTSTNTDACFASDSTALFSKIFKPFLELKEEVQSIDHD